MNGTTAPQSNMRIIMLVVITLAVNATIGLSALGYCLVFGLKPDQVLLTAYISIITGLLGVIGGMLTKTSPTETTKNVAVTDQPTITDDPKPTEPKKP